MVLDVPPLWKQIDRYRSSQVDYEVLSRPTMRDTEVSMLQRDAHSTREERSNNSTVSVVAGVKALGLSSWQCPEPGGAWAVTYYDENKTSAGRCGPADGPCGGRVDNLGIQGDHRTEGASQEVGVLGGRTDESGGSGGEACQKGGSMVKNIRVFDDSAV